MNVNLSNAELNLICHVLALLGARHILHVSWIWVKYDFCLLNWIRVDFIPQIHTNKETNSEYYIGFDEPHPYPERNFRTLTEHVGAYRAQKGDRFSFYRPKENEYCWQN
jgi:hypothetical protein